MRASGKAGLLLIAGMVAAGGFGRIARAAEPEVENGMFNLRFHFQYLPSSTDLTGLRRDVERARMQLCDATDTVVKIKKVSSSASALSERRALLRTSQPGPTLCVSDDGAPTPAHIVNCSVAA